MVEINKRGKGVLVIIRQSNAANISTKLLNIKQKTISDFREYGVGAQILRDLGVRDMILLTKAHKSIIALDGFDLKIVDYDNIED